MKKHILFGVALVVVVLIIGSLFVYKKQAFDVSSTGSFSKSLGGYGANDVDMAVENYGFAVDGEMMLQEDARAAAIAPLPPQESASPDTTLDRERLIIRSANLSVLVDNVPAAADAVANFAEAQGGFVVSSNIYKYGLSPRADVTIRVPSEKFEESLGKVGELGEVESRSVSGQDVTEEFVDVEAQVNNLKRTEAQFLTILERATKIEDVLAVQRELNTVRSQIERLEGRMNYLSKSAQLSTITVSLSSDPEALPVEQEDKWKPVAVVKNALRGLQGLAIAIADAVIWLVIYIPVWLILFFGGRMLWKKVKQK